MRRCCSSVLVRPVVTRRRRPKLIYFGSLRVEYRSLYANSEVISGYLTQCGVSLSTRRITPPHVRDRIFVSPYSTASYITTGVETRTRTDSPPAAALPARRVCARSNRRERTTGNGIVTSVAAGT